MFACKLARRSSTRIVTKRPVRKNGLFQKMVVKLLRKISSRFGAAEWLTGLAQGKTKEKTENLKKSSVHDFPPYVHILPTKKEEIHEPENPRKTQVQTHLV